MVASKTARLLASSLIFSSWAFTAQAQTCEKNEDCPQGFSCHEDTSTRDCPPVAPCADAKDCATPPSCGEEVVTHECRPASCETNADCAGNMVCHEQFVTVCTRTMIAPACGQNEKCPPATPGPDACLDTSEKLCVPRYLLPCEQASDCGEGFTCEQDMACSCSGSSGSADAPRPSEDAGVHADADAGTSKAGFAAVPPAKPAADGGVAPDAGSKPALDGGAADGGGASSCECHALEQRHCAAKLIKCQSDGECPSDFSCIADGGGAVSCASSKDRDAAVCGAPTQTNEDKICQPRFSSATWLGSRRTDAEDAPQASGSSGSSSHDTTVTGDKGGASPSAADGGASVEQDAGAKTSEPASTCSVATPGARTSSAGFVLGFILLAFGVSRRKRTRSC